MPVLFTSPRPAQPMTLPEARKIVSDIDHGMQHDPDTRKVAFLMLNAARRGEPLAVTMITLTHANALPLQPMPPKDAA